jgi:tetratricopeptide (TPR) repeat protein
MSKMQYDLMIFEVLREAGDYEKLARLLPEDWQTAPAYDEVTIRMRLLAAEIFSRRGHLDQMELALAPYLQDIDRVPFGLVASVLVMSSIYRNRCCEPAEALRLASSARAVATVRGDESTAAEAVHAEGKALWSLGRCDEAISTFEEAIRLYAGQSRTYRLALAYLSLGEVLGRIGLVEEARSALERAIRILLKFRDEYSLAVARVDAALILIAQGEYEISLKYLEFAHNTFEQMGHDRHRLTTLNKIAEALLYLKAYDKAANYIARALEVATAICSTQVASTYELKGRLHLAQQDWGKAKKALFASLDMAEQAGNRIQKLEAWRTLGKLYLAQGRDSQAAYVLREALDETVDLRAALLELELKALLSQAMCSTDPNEACRLLTEVEAAIKNRSLPELKKASQAARKRIDSLDREHFFIITDNRMPTLADAKIALLKWLWSRSLHRSKGDVREAAARLGISPAYIRKLTKLILRDLLRPAKKRSGKLKKAEFIEPEKPTADQC